MVSPGRAPDVRVLCLTGFMGSGKSTVGRLLAAQLVWRFCDLDAEIESASGLSVSEIFAQKGEAAFREIEHECLTRVLGAAAARDARLVLALGGGTFSQPRNAVLIRDPAFAKAPTDRPAAAGSPAVGGLPTTVVIWLDCPVSDLLRRCVLMGDRPLFRDEASFRKLYEERLPHYRQADYRVESGGEPMTVVEQILNLGIFSAGAPARPGNVVPGAQLS